MTSQLTLNRHKMDNYVIIASLKSEPMGILINRIPGLHLFISSLPGSDLRTHVESLSKPYNSTSVLKALPGILHAWWSTQSLLAKIVSEYDQEKTTLLSS